MGQAPRHTTRCPATLDRQSTPFSASLPSPPGQLGSPLARQIRIEQSRSALGLNAGSFVVGYRLRTTVRRDSKRRVVVRILSDARGLQCSDWRFPLPRRGRKRPARTPPTTGWIDFDHGLGVARPFSFQLPPPKRTLERRTTVSSGGAAAEGSPCMCLHRPLRGSDSRGVSGPQSKDAD